MSNAQNDIINETLLENALEHLKENPLLYGWVLDNGSVVQRYEELKADPKLFKKEKKEQDKIMLEYVKNNNLWYLIKLELTEKEFGEVFIEDKKEGIEILEEIIKIATMRRDKLKAHQQLEDYKISKEYKDIQAKSDNTLRI